TRVEQTKKLSEDGGIRPNEMIAPLVPDKIDDLIGKLLDEADEMADKFDSLTANSGLISADPGEVGKLAGRMNSSGATSTTGDQKQLIERANALRKELKNIYLPTDHLDDLIAQLNQNLEKLRENPTAEAFRTQQELLDRLRSEARVFNRAQAGFQPSLPRQQQV